MIGMYTMKSNVTERSEHKTFKTLKPYDRPVEETGRRNVVFILVQGPYFTWQISFITSCRNSVARAWAVGYVNTMKEQMNISKQYHNETTTIIITIKSDSNYNIPTTYIAFLLVNSLQKLAYYEHWQSLWTQWHCLKFPYMRLLLQWNLS